MAEQLIPSKVVDKKHIRLPEENVEESDDEWNRCGKWIISHPHKDMKFLDSAWIALQKLLDDGTLLMLKASTASMAQLGATIICFTRPGQQEARRAAKAIRKVIDFKGIMYYKLNKQTSEGVANRFGYKSVSIYMHTFHGVFYEKKLSWRPIDEDWVVPIGRKFLKKNYEGNKNLPSTYKRKCFFNLPVKGSVLVSKNGVVQDELLYLICSCEAEGPYLSEADRVWLVAQQLLKEGLFKGIAFSKHETAESAELRLYVSDEDKPFDIFALLPACDRIFTEASCRNVMYFVTSKEEIVTLPEGYKAPLHDFLYTSEGGLYRMTKYAHESISV